MGEPILPLAVDGLGYRAGGVDILGGVSLRIVPGSRNVVLGPNGAGKSVLMRLMHGLLAPTEGKVRWSVPPAAARRAQAMVFQRPVMLRRSAQENVAFALRIAGLPDPGGQAAQGALERVGLAHLAARPARLCSVGEQQRIALARAWSLSPQVLFLDEPTASLDPAATRAIEEIILAMHAQGTTIVMATHDLNQARRIASRVLFIHRGRLVEDAAATTFFQQPRAQEAAAFIRGELAW